MKNLVVGSLAAYLREDLVGGFTLIRIKSILLQTYFETGEGARVVGVEKFSGEGLEVTVLGGIDSVEVAYYDVLEGREESSSFVVEASKVHVLGMDLTETVLKAKTEGMRKDLAFLKEVVNG